MQLLKTKGRIVYDPKRKDLKKTFKERTMIIELPWDDLDLYYQWFLRKQCGSWFDYETRKQVVFNEQQTGVREIVENSALISRPMWGKHVTVVRGDEPGHKSKNWGKHDGEMIDVYYTPKLIKTWKFWSLEVCGNNLIDFRRELGLRAYHNFHITIAREH